MDVYIPTLSDQVKKRTVKNEVEPLFIESKDDINQPGHYTSHPSKIECIEITKHHNFCIGNVIKYVWRAGLKDSETQVNDLKKAIKYLQFEIERIEHENYTR